MGKALTGSLVGMHANQRLSRTAIRWGPQGVTYMLRMATKLHLSLNERRTKSYRTYKVVVTFSTRKKRHQLMHNV